jgi:hypothetical protein
MMEPLVKNELERMWKEAVAASFGALLRNMFGGTEGGKKEKFQ